MSGIFSKSAPRQSRALSPGPPATTSVLVLPGSGVSLSQARIDAIWRPGLAQGATFLRWLKKLQDAPEVYSPQVLKQQSEKLGAEIAALKRLVWLSPEEELTTEEFSKQARRLAKMQGQQAAICWTLDHWSPNTPVRATPTSSPGWTQSTETLAPGLDPFAQE